MYDDIAPSYNALHGAEQRRKLERLLAHVDIAAGMRVIDVGCGTAHLASYFTEQDYVGVDPSQPLLDQSPDGVKTVCAAGERLPFPDDSFDLALSLTALHNYDDWRKGVDELFRVARTVIVGVLRKSSEHDAIIERLIGSSEVVWRGDDPHDTLLVLSKP